MARTPRPNRPGTVFHLTTRTQGHEAWFTPTIRSRIASYIVEGMAIGGARLLAYAVMPNHLHIVVQQGERSLGRLMQPLLGRTALLVQRCHGLEGHIFERRFRDKPCLDPDHARAAIVYSHLNGVRAGLAPSADLYPWSSHAHYVRVEPPVGPVGGVAWEVGLRLFGSEGSTSPAQLRGGYLRCLEWMMKRDAYEAALARGDDAGLTPPTEPDFAGTAPWSDRYAPLFPTLTPCPPTRSQTEPEGAALERVTMDILAETGGRISLEDLRSTRRTPGISAVRRMVVVRATTEGCRGTAIACYLGISQQRVSAIAAEVRRGRRE